MAGFAPAYYQGGPNKESTGSAKPRKPPKGRPSLPPKRNNRKFLPNSVRRKAEFPRLPAFAAMSTPLISMLRFSTTRATSSLRFPRKLSGSWKTERPQTVSSFGIGEGTMTVSMVIEFSNLYQRYWTETWYQTLTASYGFLETSNPRITWPSWLTICGPEILSDFSTDKRKAYEAMQRLRIPAFSESNLYDALVDTAERMNEIEGRKAIVLLSTGVDTFSKLTFDKTRKALQNAGVPIYGIGLMQTMRELIDAYGAMGPIARLDFLQADNQMRTFAKETGGMSFFPRFYGEFPRFSSRFRTPCGTNTLLRTIPRIKRRTGSSERSRWNW